MKSLKKEILQTRSFRNEYHQANVNLIYTAKWIIKLHTELFNKYGLTMQQYNILRILKGKHPDVATIKYIKRRMLDKMSDASRIVEVLNKKELIRRIPNNEDRRKVDVTILPKGLELLKEIEKEDDYMDGFLSKLNAEEINLLNELLDKARPE